MLLNELIIGCSLMALQKCYETGKSLILTRHQNPYFFETSKEEITIQDVSTRSLHDAWNYLVFLLSLRGQVINPGPVEKIFFLDDKTIAISGVSDKIEFKFCEVYDPQKIIANFEEVRTINKDMYKVLDWVNIRSGGNTEATIIENDSSFVQKVYLYSSRRNGTNTGKDILAISYLTQEQTNSFEYSDTYVRFYLEKILLEKGYKGKKQNDSFRKIILETSHREVIPIQRTLYKNEKNIKFYEPETF